MATFFRQMASSVLVSLLSLSTASSVLAKKKKQEQREAERGGKVKKQIGAEG